MKRKEVEEKSQQQQQQQLQLLQVEKHRLSQKKRESSQEVSQAEKDTQWVYALCPMAVSFVASSSYGAP